MNAAWGLLQWPRSPQEEKVPVNPAWPFGDRAQGWGKFWVSLFSSGKWYCLVGAPGALLPAPAALLCSALSLPSLSDFVPIDLEEWWAQQFLAKIENCS